MKVETFALERWMSTWEMNVEFDIAESGIYPMTTREIIDLLPEEQRAAALDEVLDTRLGYTEARGTAALRSLIAETYRATSPEEILVTTGAIEANYLLFNTLLDAGDHIVTIYPAYQQLYAVAQAIGCDVSLWKLREEHQFRYDLDELERLVTPKTKLIVVNTPHNPTGAMLSAEQLRRVYDLAESFGAWLMCDEAYRWLDLPGGEPMAPPIRDYGHRGISVGTFSKPFGLPGLRIGWIAGPEEIVKACWAARDYISLSPGKLNDKLAQIALANRERIIARNHAIVTENMATAERWFAENADLVTWTPPRAGLLALMTYNVAVPSKELSDRLAGEYSVMLAPGSAFGFEGHLRIGVGQTPEIFKEGLFRAAACLRDLKARRDAS
ncbi:MAG: aminotransferase class I/II-fold pyridoxal phosphate-dependent enzyme [Thermomicrobiales bacterium]|nr:aminotransferase class I/II-fold pyridoxal phosphate-dependent enzyme [Thermomicrobiales bacterium]